MCALAAHFISKKSLTEVTAGVTIGDPVLRTGKPLSVELGPGQYVEAFTSFYLCHQSWFVNSVNTCRRS